MTADKDNDFLPGDENAKSDVDSGDYELHQKIRPGDVVLDLGAHVGFFTMLASDRVGKDGQVIAFEPCPRNYSKLRANIAGHDNVVAYPIAAWNRNEMVELWHNRGNSGGHSLFRNEQHSHSELVPAINIRNFVFGMSVKPDFIKMDIEGSEIGVMQCLPFSELSNTHVALEVHSEDIATRLKGLLFPYNFRPKNSTVGLWYVDL